MCEAKIKHKQTNLENLSASKVPCAWLRHGRLEIILFPCSESRWRSGLASWDHILGQECIITVVATAQPMCVNSGKNTATKNMFCFGVLVYQHSNSRGGLDHFPRTCIRPFSEHRLALSQKEGTPCGQHSALLIAEDVEHSKMTF